MNIFITGGTGFVGKNLVSLLLKNNNKVSALCRNNSFKTHDNLTAIIGNLESLNDLILPKQCDAIIHLAGVVAYKKSEYNKMFKTNVEGTKSVINFALKNKIPKIIYLSSVVTNANFTDELTNEQSSYNTFFNKFGYHKTKKLAEDYFIKRLNNDFEGIALCPSNIYGPSDHVKPSRKNQVKAMNGKLKICSNGGVSILHIDDLLNCIIQSLTLNSLPKKTILSGENISIKKLIETICFVSNSNKPKLCLPNSVLRGLSKIGNIYESSGKDFFINPDTLYLSTLNHWFDNSLMKKTFSLEPKSSYEAISSSVKSYLSSVNRTNT